MKRMILLVLSLLGLGFCAFTFFGIKKHAQQATTVDSSGHQKMRKFIHNKLWRDKAIEKMEQQHGDIIHRKVLTDKEYAHELELKLLEEAAEVVTAKSAQEMASEIGDVLEVLDCIIALHGLSKDDIEKARAEKRDERGSYLERKFVTSTESVPGSFLDLYCSKAPEKYTLIVD